MEVVLPGSVDFADCHFLRHDILLQTQKVVMMINSRNSSPILLLIFNPLSIG
jgi:hypothetical protein